jgi:hypothetical protein
MSSLLQELQAFTDAVFENDKLVAEELVRLNGKEVLGEVKSKGFAIRKNLTDKQARSVFVTIQASAERKTVDDVAKATGTINLKSEVSIVKEEDVVARKAYVSLQVASEKAITDRLSAAKDLGRIAKSIWVIHTPVIATPCVTDGTPTPNLLAEEIAKDEARRKLTLSRAEIIRDYLKAGGVLIVAYNACEREEKLDDKGTVIAPGRTKAQIAIYEALRKEYPKQIIDFPMELKGQPYPDDMIGATYLVEDTYGQRFEMTNRGVQANKPHDDAEWGVWMHNRTQAVPEVAQRMGKVFSFLQKSGLNTVLDNHARENKINQDEYAPLLSRYMSLEIDTNKGFGCKVQ